MRLNPDGSTPEFTWISLGVSGGLDESNLSAHLLAPYGSTDFVCLDAGTLLAGLRVAAQQGCFSDISVSSDPESTLEGAVLRHHIKAYLISHCYLDHVNGLAAVSPDDSSKPIIGLPGTIDDLRDSIFNWCCWPNMANEGVEPHIGQYTYVRLEEGRRTPVPETSMHVRAFPLAHAISTDSAAFLIESQGAYALYMGDTGPDEIEQRTTTMALWEEIAPLVRDRRLRVISLESSYLDGRPDELLFGHLTPSWVLKAFRKLASLVNPEHPSTALEGLTVMITHVKPDELLTEMVPVRESVQQQLHSQNDLGIRFVLPRQGQRFDL